MDGNRKHPAAGVYTHLHEQFFWITLAREPLNNLTVEMMVHLARTVQEAIKSQPRLVILRSAGETFCSGLDLPIETEAERAALSQTAQNACLAFTALRASAIPSVAIVKGNAFGIGCELLSLCETIIAREDATFRLPAMNAPVFPCAHSIYLPALIGRENATRLMKSGETIDARTAMRLGLVHQVLSTRSFPMETEELLIMLASISVPPEEGAKRIAATPTPPEQ